MTSYSTWKQTQVDFFGETNIPLMAANQLLIRCKLFTTSHNHQKDHWYDKLLKQIHPQIVRAGRMSL